MERKKADSIRPIPVLVRKVDVVLYDQQAAPDVVVAACPWPDRLLAVVNTIWPSAILITKKILMLARQDLEILQIKDL